MHIKLPLLRRIENPHLKDLACGRLTQKQLLSVPLPQSQSDRNTQRKVEQLAILMEQKRELVKEPVIGSGAWFWGRGTSVLRNGWY